METAIKAGNQKILDKKKLKILFVLQAPWGTELGIAKVHYELKAAMEAMGHTVDYLDLSQLYPQGYTLWQQIKGPIYQKRILAQLKKIAHQYDVIDANYDCVPFPKESFGFNGLLIYRSHGLQPLYRQVEQSAPYKRMEYKYLQRQLSFKTKIGNLLRFLAKKNDDWILWDCLHYADVVHALNQAEYDYFEEYGISKSRLILVPNGLDDTYIDAGEKFLNNIEQRDEISFVGSWSLRKGIMDLPDIISSVVDRVSKVNLLGTGNGAETILANFSEKIRPKLNIVPHFDIADLPELLSRTKLGIFPSYIEGFGLAVVEQMSLGIPVIAYDIPGPSGILEPINYKLLVKMGDKQAFSKRLTELLHLSVNDYRMLAEKTYFRAQDFKNSVIAAQFVDAYHRKIAELL